MNSNAYPIKEEWENHYHTLEWIRKSDITNMWGAASFLAEAENIDNNLAKEILVNWISNYTELKNRYNW